MADLLITLTLTRSPWPPAAVDSHFAVRHNLEQPTPAPNLDSAIGLVTSITTPAHLIYISFYHSPYRHSKQQLYVHPFSRITLPVNNLLDAFANENDSSIVAAYRIQFFNLYLVSERRFNILLGAFLCQQTAINPAGPTAELGY